MREFQTINAEPWPVWSMVTQIASVATLMAVIACQWPEKSVCEFVSTMKRTRLWAGREKAVAGVVHEGEDSADDRLVCPKYRLPGQGTLIKRIEKAVEL
jgi:hypothetical protein